MKKTVVVLFVLLCFSSGFYLSQGLRDSRIDKASRTSAAIGLQLPDFELADIAGEIRKTSEWTGKVRVLNFWATWCPPCREEIPMFIKLQEKYADQGLQFVGIALEDPEPIVEFIADIDINYPLLVGQYPVIKLASAVGNHAGILPYTIFVNRQGKIAFIKQGAIKQAEAEQLINALL